MVKSVRNVRLPIEIQQRIEAKAAQNRDSFSATLRAIVERGLDATEDDVLSLRTAIAGLVESNREIRDRLGSDDIQGLTRSLLGIVESNQEVRDRLGGVEFELSSITSTMPDVRHGIDAVLTSATADDAHRTLIVKTLCELLTVNRFLIEAARPDVSRSLKELTDRQYAAFVEAVGSEAKKLAGIRTTPAVTEIPS